MGLDFAYGSKLSAAESSATRAAVDLGVTLRHLPKPMAPSPT